MTLKLMLAAFGAAAVVAGFCLPTTLTRPGPHAEPKSQIQLIELGRR